MANLSQLKYRNHIEIKLIDDFLIYNFLFRIQNEIVTKCGQLKLEAAAGKKYLTDVANPETSAGQTVDGTDEYYKHRKIKHSNNKNLT